MYEKEIDAVYPLSSVYYEISMEGRKEGLGPLLWLHSFQYTVTYWLPSLQPSSLSSEYRYLIMADNQNRPYRFHALLERLPVLPIPGSLDAHTLESSSSEEPPVHLPYHFLLHVGDAVQHAFVLRDWSVYFWQVLERHGLTRLPLLFAHGNHDVAQHVHLSHYTKIRPTWYTRTLGPVHWIILDYNVFAVDALRQKQFDWLLSHLAEPGNACEVAGFCVLVVHCPPYGEFWDPVMWNGTRQEYLDTQRTRTFLNDLYTQVTAIRRTAWAENRLPIDLIISGHQHNYQRGMHPETLIMHTIVGGAGGDLDLTRVDSYGFYDVTHLEHCIVEMTVSNTTLFWKAIDLSGRILDAFTLSARSKLKSPS